MRSLRRIAFRVEIENEALLLCSIIVMVIIKAVLLSLLTVDRTSSPWARNSGAVNRKLIAAATMVIVRE
jgi:hypothetical protein